MQNKILIPLVTLIMIVLLSAIYLGYDNQFDSKSEGESIVVETQKERDYSKLKEINDSKSAVDQIFLERDIDVLSDIELDQLAAMQQEIIESEIAHYSENLRDQSVKKELSNKIIAAESYKQQIVNKHKTQRQPLTSQLEEDINAVEGNAD